MDKLWHSRGRSRALATVSKEESKEVESRSITLTICTLWSCHRDLSGSQELNGPMLLCGPREVGVGVNCGLLELGPAAIPKRLSRTPSSAHQHRNTITAHTPHETTHPPHHLQPTNWEHPNYTSTQPTTATMAQEDAAKRIEEAKQLSKDSPAKAEAIYKEILSQPPGTSDKAVREFETALLGLGELYRDHKRTQDLANLIQQTREVLTTFTKAKTSKLSE
jgi:hypothetical protein